MTASCNALKGDGPQLMTPSCNVLKEMVPNWWQPPAMYWKGMVPYWWQPHVMYWNGMVPNWLQPPVMYWKGMVLNWWQPPVMYWLSACYKSLGHLERPEFLLFLNLSSEIILHFLLAYLQIGTIKIVNKFLSNLKTLTLIQSVGQVLDVYSTLSTGMLVRY